MIGFVDDLAKVESHFGNGIVHMHKMIEDVAKPYGIEHEELYVGTPSTSKMFGELLKERSLKPTEAQEKIVLPSAEDVKQEKTHQNMLTGNFKLLFEHF